MRYKQYQICRLLFKARFAGAVIINIIIIAIIVIIIVIIIINSNFSKHIIQFRFA